MWGLLWGQWAVLPTPSSGVLLCQEGLLEWEVEGKCDVKVAVRVLLPIPSLAGFIAALGLLRPCVSDPNMKFFIIWQEMPSGFLIQACFLLMPLAGGQGVQT